MFTGLVEELGSVRALRLGAQSGCIEIKAHRVLEGTRLGDSIAVNGVCLTVTALESDGFSADVMPETLRRSNLGQLRPGDPVNLERAMAADGRFGGHIVSGHIDGTGRITRQWREGNAVWLRIQAEPALLRLVVEKGSIAIDGVSLTVAAVGEDSLSVSLIPTTADETILLSRRPGAQVNLETDIIGKYVQRLLGLTEEKKTPASGGLTLEFLQQNGF